MIQEPYQVDMIENFLGAPIDLVTLLPLLLLYLRQTAWMLEEKEVLYPFDIESSEVDSKDDGDAHSKLLRVMVSTLLSTVRSG